MLFIEARGRREGWMEERKVSSRQQRETEGGRQGRVKWIAGERESERERKLKGWEGDKEKKGDSEKERKGSQWGREGVK